jgi:starch synthase
MGHFRQAQTWAKFRTRGLNLGLSCCKFAFPFQFSLKKILRVEKSKILFATMEIDPFLRITEAADFIRDLPKGLQDRGYEIRILMPKFGVINERRNRLHEVVRLSGINIRVGNEEKPLTIKVATIPDARLQVYFLDNEDYFKRKSVLVDPKSDSLHQDNDERAIFFCKGVIETVKKLGWSPDIIHCHGWMTSLIPMYLKTHFREDPIFNNSKIVYTLYDHEMNATLPNNFADKARLDGVSQDEIRQYMGSSYYELATGGVQLADAAALGNRTYCSPMESIISKMVPNIHYDQNGGDVEEYINYYHNIYQNILN